MAFLSHRRVVDEASGTYVEEISFVGASREAVDTEMRQWVMRTLPRGTGQVVITMTDTTNGEQHEVFVSYLCIQQAEDRVEPMGLFHSTQG